MDYRILKKIDTDTAIGKRIISFLITEENRKKLSAYLKNRQRARMLRHEFEDRASNFKDLISSSVQHITPVTQPLMLVFDLPPFGGTLLNQLFDGHSQLHVHPGKIMLSFDEQKRSIGPILGTNPVKRPQKWFSVLAQNCINEHLEEVHRYLDIVDSSQPMVFIPYLQRRIFLRYMKSAKSCNMRTVCDAYMTSYFGSWLNYANLYGHDKKFIIGYSKTHAMPINRMKQFFEVYPDGKITFIIRNPINWIRTTSSHHAKNPLHTQSTINHWLESTEALIWIKEAFNSRVCIIQHMDLTGKTEAVMRHLSQFLSIKFDRTLLNPTFNGSKAKAIDYADIGEDSKAIPLERHGAALPEALEANWHQTLNTYEAVMSKSVQF
jgi:hypothetical protein